MPNAQGSGISTYLLNLIRELQSNNNHQKLNYLVNEYSRVISPPPDYSGQHRFRSKIYSVSEQIFYPSILRKDVLHVLTTMFLCDFLVN